MSNSLPSACRIDWCLGSLLCKEAALPCPAIQGAACHRAQEPNEAQNAKGVAEAEDADQRAPHALHIAKHLRPTAGIGSDLLTHW